MLAVILSCSPSCRLVVCAGRCIVSIHCVRPLIHLEPDRLILSMKMIGAIAKAQLTTKALKHQVPSVRYERNSHLKKYFRLLSKVQIQWSICQSIYYTCPYLYICPDLSGTAFNHTFDPRLYNMMVHSSLSAVTCDVLCEPYCDADACSRWQVSSCCDAIEAYQRGK